MGFSHVKSKNIISIKLRALNLSALELFNPLNKNKPISCQKNSAKS